MTALDEDIIEYSKTIERLQEENKALKQMLRRFMTFASPGDPGNLYDADLSHSLRDAESLLQNLFYSIKVPAFMGIISDSDPESRDFIFTQVNKPFADFCCLSAKEIVGQSNAALRLLKSEQWIQIIFASCKTLDSCSLMMEEGGEMLDVSIIGSSHTSFVVNFVPSSEAVSRQRTLNMIQDLKLYQTVVDSIPTPLFYKDMLGRFRICNQSYSRDIVGVSPEDIIGKTAPELKEILHKDCAGFNPGKDLQLIKEEGVQTFQEAIKCADSNVREFIVNKTIVKNRNGQNAGILGVMQDVGSIMAARRELSDSKSRYKTLFNSISQPIIVVDIDGNIIMLNTSAVELFEEDEVSLMDNTVQVIPALSLINMEYVRKVYETQEQITYRVPICKAGKERWYFCTMQPIRDFSGQPVVQIISDDITDIKHYQAEILKQKQRAEESNTLKNIFLGNIAQETRFPANMICGLAQMMKAGINPSKHSEYISIIYRNCRKLLEIIDDIVQLSQIESGQIELRHEICSINSIIEEAHLYLEDRAGESGKPITISHGPLLGENESLVYADSLCINQAFKKLIANAVAFTDSGRIEVGAEISQNLITFYVSDTGIGISKDKINEIFERFRQVDENSNSKYLSKGLGLPIVNELVKCMKGSISITSSVGKGSCFRFSIPYCKAEV